MNETLRLPQINNFLVALHENNHLLSPVKWFYELSLTEHQRMITWKLNDLYFDIGPRNLYCALSTKDFCTEFSSILVFGK